MRHPLKNYTSSSGDVLAACEAFLVAACKGKHCLSKSNSNKATQCHCLSSLLAKDGATEVIAKFMMSYGAAPTKQEQEDMLGSTIHLGADWCQPLTYDEMYDRDGKWKRQGSIFSEAQTLIFEENKTKDPCRYLLSVDSHCPDLICANALMLLLNIGIGHWRVMTKHYSDLTLPCDGKSVARGWQYLVFPPRQFCHGNKGNLNGSQYLQDAQAPLHLFFRTEFGFGFPPDYLYVFNEAGNYASVVGESKRTLYERFCYQHGFVVKKTCGRRGTYPKLADFKERDDPVAKEEVKCMCRVTMKSFEKFWKTNYPLCQVRIADRGHAFYPPTPGFHHKKQQDNETQQKKKRKKGSKKKRKKNTKSLVELLSDLQIQKQNNETMSVIGMA